MLVPNRALLRLAGELADSGFRGVVRAHYVKRRFRVLTIEFIIYKRPSTTRRFWVRVKRVLEVIPSLIIALIVGLILAIFFKCIV